MDPIFFRGEQFSAQKLYFQGTHRVRTPEETWEVIAPLAVQAGVTRVSNITGLDRIGIPVTLAIRPTALMLATSSGKGMTLEIANVSGLMEAIEVYCGEMMDLPCLHLPYSELRERVATIPKDLLPLRRGTLFQTDWPERWVVGWDLCKQEEVAAPLLSVLMNFHTYRQVATELNSFESSTNGLASGNHFLEALASGMYELIERDAISCHLYASSVSSFASPKVKLETIPYLSVRHILEKLKAAEIRPLLYDCTVDTGVFTFKAEIYDLKISHSMATLGYGTHLDPEVAMIRALTEAVQGRGIVIAGSRDDLFPSQFELMKKYDQCRDPDYFDSPPATVDATGYSPETTTTLHGDVQLLLSKLKSAGISQVIVFDLTAAIPAALSKICVLRVLIPGLEGYPSPVSKPGARAKQFADLLKTQTKVFATNVKKQAHFPSGAAT